MSDPHWLPEKYKKGGSCAKTLYIIRHGETDLNKRGIVQGRGMDTDLNAVGRSQAQAFYEAYKHIPFDTIYTSTLKRTHQTVDQFIHTGISWIQLTELDELAWGIYEGQENNALTKAAFQQMTKNWMRGELHYKFEQGESPLEVKKRQLVALEKLMASQDKQILICMHGRALRLFLCLLTETSLVKMDLFPHLNTSLYKVQYDGYGFKIIDFNNIDHLQINT